MLLCGIDIETTGLLDDDCSEITELSWVFMETPLFKSPPIISQNFCQIIGDMPEKITELTGITGEHLELYGLDIRGVIQSLDHELSIRKPDALVFHRGIEFDLPFINREAKKFGFASKRLISTPIIDTSQDIEAEFETRKLSYMAAEHGFINPFPHSAVFDVMTTMKVLSNYDVQEVLFRAMEPKIQICAKVGYDSRELASKPKNSKYRFFWAADKKRWLKTIRESELEDFRKNCAFEIEEV